jgi:alcohol dehydrogenase class IV
MSGLGKKALVVTGKSAIRSGLRDRAVSQLNDAGIDSVFFDGVGSNPTMGSVDSGAGTAVSEGCDCVLVIGGGSQIDAAKAMALVAGNGGSVRDYLGGKGNVPGLKALPVVAVATTCGTGSEVNGICVLTDEETRDKGGMTSRTVVPKTSIVDPALMETMPPTIMASVSFDAFCHLAESYISGGRDEYTDGICANGLSLLSMYLLRANRDIHDVHALDAVCMASTMAGIVIYKAGTTAPHALEHPLSGLRNIPHGEGLAAVSPEIYRRCSSALPDRFSEMSRMFGGKDHSDFDSAVTRITAELGIDRTLSELGFGSDDIPWLTDSAVRNAGSKFGRHPVPMDRDVTESIYRAIL